MVAQEAGIECNKKIFFRDEIMQRVFRGYLESSERINYLSSIELVNTCKKLISRSVLTQGADTTFDAVQNATTTIGYLQNLSQMMKQTKGTGSKQILAAHNGVQ